MTKGERIVGTFNPSQNDYISAVKAKFVNLIDFIDSNTKVVLEDHLSKEAIGDIERLRSIAFTKLEEACMFAVKAKVHVK